MTSVSARIAFVVAGAALAAGVGWVVARRWIHTGDEAIDSGSIVLLGDSITAEGRWPELLPRWPVVNRGRSGYTTEQLVPVAREIASSHPRMVFVLTGTNDIRDGLPASVTGRQLEAIVDAIASTTPDTEIVLQTILPRADAPEAVRAANHRIEQLAAQRNLRLLDLHSAFDDGAGGLRSTETSDGVHLTSAGYARWSALLEQELSALTR
jgi:lysophospholipase L1-like esterase